MNTFKRNQTLFVLMCVTLVLALTIGNVNASPTLQTKTDFAAIDAYVTTQLKDLGIPGMALGIVQDGKIVHLQGFGVADSSGRAVTPQTPFYLASVTKSFTALAVMQLVEAGKINLDAPVQKYLPWFELTDKVASAKITVRHLLNHTTGISRIDGERDWPRQQGLEETVRGLINTIQPTEPVGTTFQYSNLNYITAGLIVEKVSGQSYADYVTQHIFEPLDMRHSYTSRAPAMADGLSEGHYYMVGHAFVERAEPPFALPAGGLIASGEDLSHYALAHLNNGRYGDTSILSPQRIAELHVPAIPMNWEDSYYAMGWNVSTWDGIPMVWHNGDVSRYHSIFILMPDRGSGVVLLANASGFEQLWQVDDIAKSVVSMLNGKSPAPVSLPFLFRFLYWAILLTPLLMIIGSAYSWRYWRNKGVVHIVLTVILYGTVALLWLFGVPQMIGSPIWPGIRTTFPELAYGLIAGATLGLGWSVIYTAMNLRARRSK